MDKDIKMIIGLGAVAAGIAGALFLGNKKSPNNALVNEFITRMRTATTSAGLNAIYAEAGQHYSGYLLPEFTDDEFARITAVYRALPWPES